MNKFHTYIILFLFLPFFLTGAEPQIYDFTFTKGSEDWVGEFSDYPINEETFYELAWGWENLPVELPADDSKNSSPLTKGLFLAGNNHSDDLFMFVKHKIIGLNPNSLYALNFSVTIQTNIPEGLIGIGGSVGESVYFKVGASQEEPLKIAVNDYYLLNIDKGNQSEGGQNAQVIGNLANPAVDPQNPEFLPKQLASEIPLQVKSNQAGELWIYVGTDSGYEGFSKFYIPKISLSISKADMNGL